MSASSSHTSTLFATLKHMWPFARRYAKRILFSLALLMLAGAIQLSLPLAIRQLLDRLLDQRDLAGLHVICAALVVIFVLRSVLTFIGQYNLQLTGDTITNGIRITLLRHYQSLPLGYHHSHRVGEFISRVYSDAPEVRNVVTNLAVSGTINLVQLIGASVVMLYMNWVLGLVVLVLCPATTVVGHLYGPRFRKLSADIKNSLANAMAYAQEVVSGTHVVRIFAADGRCVRKFEEMMGHFHGLTAQGRWADASYGAIIAFLTVISTILLFWVGGSQIASGAMTVGSLVAFFLYSQNVNQSITSIAQLYSSVNQSMGASSKVFELLNEASEELAEPASRIFNDSEATIEFREVTFQYHNEIPVLNRVSFHARPGEMIAIVGKSGAGKSSLLGLIPRFYTPSAGEILLNGININEYSLQSLRSAISMVSQDVFLFSASVRENIRFGRPGATDQEVEDAARHANAHDFIVELKNGYDTEVGERGVQLSGGQRQRIAIARALLRDAPILILDEATSAVDSKTDQLIHEALVRLAAKRTTFVVAHRSLTIEGADKVIALDGQDEVNEVNEVHAADPTGDDGTSPARDRKAA